MIGPDHHGNAQIPEVLRGRLVVLSRYYNYWSLEFRFKTLGWYLGKNLNNFYFVALPPSVDCISQKTIEHLIYKNTFDNRYLMLVWVFLLHIHVYYLIDNVWISHVSNHLVQNEIFVPFNGNDKSKRSPRMTQVFAWKHPKRLPNCIYLIIPCLHKSVDVWRVALLTVHQNSIRTLNRTQPLSLGTLMVLQQWILWN